MSLPDRSLRPAKHKWLSVGILVVFLFVAGLYAIRFDFQSYAFLIHFLDPRDSNLFLRWETHPVITQEITLALSHGPARARLYLPGDVSHPPGMVVVHGIHHLGMDEPRLASFARSAAEAGYAVLTPQIDALAEYHVDGASIATIGESAAWLEDQLHTGSVTVVGVSFAGGLSLLAACDPQYAPHMRALLVMGAYDDLARVSRFLATSEAELPGGSREPYKAHDYGAAVFVYSHLKQFFAPADLAEAHEALRDWLWEQPEQAQSHLSRLSSEGRATMELLMARKIDMLRPKLLEVIAEDQGQLAAISPSGKLAGLRVPVFLLHGAADDIIPSTETLWLEEEIPRAYLRSALITRAFSHVDPQQAASWRDELRLVHFLAGVLRAAN